MTRRPLLVDLAVAALAAAAIVILAPGLAVVGLLALLVLVVCAVSLLIDSRRG